MRLGFVVLLPGLAASLGCAGTVSGSGDELDAEAARTTSALVSIERTVDGTQGSRAEASARFLRVTAPATGDDAVRAIGATLELPAQGSCAAVSTRAARTAGPLPVVELLDVGTVSLEAAGVETRLSPRQLPDVTDVVHGVVYARATDPALLPSGARYVVRVAGGAELGGFETAVSAPGDPGEVRIAGESEAGVLSASGATIDLTWTPAQDDLVYVDVRPEQTDSVRCTLGDGGTGSIPALLLDEAGTLLVHRLHREALRARGIDAGEVRFDFARTVTYVRP